MLGWAAFVLLGDVGYNRVGVLCQPRSVVLVLDFKLESSVAFVAFLFLCCASAAPPRKGCCLASRRVCCCFSHQRV